VNVQRIWEVDVCRDGGSYSLCFDADDGRWYELFLRVQLHRSRRSTHHPPVIYLEGVDGGKVVQVLTWVEARQFVASLNYDSPRFIELLKVIAVGSDPAR
jgi:hypothetical protein